ncbi:uncharacterized protein LOC143446631 isoform X2 [Clavelina lepadiformis]|uniref:uncharacterized protein LOC143446631 isoform X2 n=1 Tax=Clavelina lepadiformis TaxID=159417 RepID=UPI004042703E
MSKTPRTPRAKSSGIRPLGAIHYNRGLHHVGTSPKANDPALLINQLQTNPTTVVNNGRDIAKEREYQVKERKFKDQITSLEKLIAELRQEIKRKSEECQELQTTISKQAKDFDIRFMQCQDEHNQTKEILSIAQEEVKHGKKRLESTVETYEFKIKNIIDDYEKKLRDLQESKERELAEKDEKMKLLKQRMAESLGKNSQERQQQLEELKKDLIKQAQEARNLQQKLKHLQLKPPQCGNCAKLEDKLEEKQLQLRLKEKTITDLQGIGKKMQIQLHQQHKSVVLKDIRRNETFSEVCTRLGLKQPQTKIICEYSGDQL